MSELDIIESNAVSIVGRFSFCELAAYIGLALIIKKTAIVNNVLI